MVKSDSLGKILFALIIGGAVGNLFDRFTYFAVADFIDFHINLITGSHSMLQIFLFL